MPVVARSRLVNRLRVARDARLVLITAPAGYGKTALVEAWARRDGRPFAWLDQERASGPRELAADLAASVSRATTGAAAAALPSGEPDEILGLLGHELAAAGVPVVLVLDNVALPDDAIPLLSRFIEELPPESQLVVASRARPELPVARFRARGQLLELDTCDLGFTNREAASLARSSGVDLPIEAVEALNRQLAGWPAGWRMTLEALRSGVAGLMDPVPGLPELLSYLDTEVYGRLSGAERKFLRRIAVLERVCGPLCDAVAKTTDSAQMLADLTRSGFFIVPLDREGRWYRLHPKLRRLLAAELEHAEPGTVDELLRRAAEWCVENDEPEQALDYASARHDGDQLLVSVIERSALPFAPAANVVTLERWLSPVNADTVLTKHPSVAAAGALTWALGGRAEVAWWWAATVERTDPDGPWAALLRALMRPRGPREMLADAEVALQELAPASPWRVPALLALGTANALLGEGLAAQTAFLEAADTASAARSDALQAVALACESLLASERDDWPRAEAVAGRARRIVAELEFQDSAVSLFALTASARAALRRGEWALVREELAHAELLLPLLTPALGPFAAFLRLELARVQLALGDREGAERLLREVDEIFALNRELGVFRTEADELRIQLDSAAHTTAEMSSLTAAELRLLPLLTTYLSFREIAGRLYVSRNTVKTQAISVYRKLGVSSRGEAIARAVEVGLISGDLPAGDCSVR